MPKEETIELRHIRGVIGEKTDLASIKASSSLSTELKSMIAKQSGIPQLIHTYGGADVDTSLTLGADEYVIYSIWSDGTKLYLGVNQTTLPSNGAIVKIDLATFVVENRLSFPDGVVDPVSQVSDGTFLYVATVPVGSPGQIIKIRLSTFTIVSTLTLDVGDTPITQMVSDGSFLYCSFLTDPASVAKISLTTFTKVGATLVLDPAYFNARCLYTDGWFLYLGVDGSPGIIVKIDLDTFTFNNSLTVSDGDNVYSLLSDGMYMYALHDLGFVTKIYLYPFTESRNILIGTAGSTSNSLVTDGTYIYVGTIDNPSYIYAIDISVFSIPGKKSTFGAGDGTVQSMFCDGNYIYTGMSNSPNPVTLHRRYIIPEANLYERSIMDIDTLVNNINNNTLSTALGKRNVKKTTVSELTDAGAITIASIPVTSSSVVVESIIIYSENDPQPAEFTSCAITDTSGKITFIDAIDASAANLSLYRQQVSWTGSVALKQPSDGIVMTFVGLPSLNSVTFDVYITYYAADALNGELV